MLKFYIKKIVRDDGQQLVFDQNEIYLDHENTLLVHPEVDTTYQDYTEANGGEMIAQKLPSFEQPIKGLIIPKTSTYWALRSRLTAFFQIPHTFFVVYEKISGDTFTVGDKFKTGTAWISESLQIPPEPYEEYSGWTVTLRIGSAGYLEYEEDASGKEIYANIVNIPLTNNATGGSQWDEYGQEWDAIGQVYSAGDGGIQTINVSSTQAVYPVWEVEGECINPEIRNNANDTIATYNGTVAAGQKLVVDFTAGTATLDGSIVTRNLSGTLKLDPGENLIGFENDGGSTNASTLKWNNYL